MNILLFNQNYIYQMNIIVFLICFAVSLFITLPKSFKAMLKE